MVAFVVVVIIIIILLTPVRSGDIFLPRTALFLSLCSHQCEDGAEDQRRTERGERERPRDGWMEEMESGGGGDTEEGAAAEQVQHKSINPF